MALIRLQTRITIEAITIKTGYETHTYYSAWLFTNSDIYEVALVAYYLPASGHLPERVRIFPYAWHNSFYYGPDLYSGHLHDLSLPISIDADIQVDTDARTFDAYYDGNLLKHKDNLTANQVLRRGFLGTGNYCVLLALGSDFGNDDNPNVEGIELHSNFDLSQDGNSIFADDLTESRPQWEHVVYDDATYAYTEDGLRMYYGIDWDSVDRVKARLYLPPPTLSALLSPSRITHICANDGADLLNYRRLPGVAMGSVPTYKVETPSSNYSVGLCRIAGSILNYFNNGDAIISYIDGTVWSADNMETITAWAGYTPKHVCQQGRTQYAVLYKEATTKKLWFSRNFKGTATDWSAPSLIVGSLASEPNAWIVPQPDGSLIAYVQVGSATPVAYKCARADGVGWS